MFVRACMYVCVCVCVCVCISWEGPHPLSDLGAVLILTSSLHVCACVHVCMHIYTNSNLLPEFVCVYACTYLYVYVYIYIYEWSGRRCHLCDLAALYVCMHVCKYVLAAPLILNSSVCVYMRDRHTHTCISRAIRESFL